MNVNIKRLERALKQFYLPLRDGHPKEYIKQSKAVNFIRRHTGLSDYDKLHWAYSVLHYLQILLVLGTPVSLSSGIFLTFEESIRIYISFWFAVASVFCLFENIFGCIQSTRCSKIKKTDPKYAKCEVLRWIKP